MVPALVSQLNLYVDKHGVIRVRSKFDRWADHAKFVHPVLLSKNSALTASIIWDIHRGKGHAGCYSVLNELRKQFYVPSHFSTIKKVLKSCVTCRRVNARSIKTSQNAYRDFRVSPPNVPYRYIYLDHFGPYQVKINGASSKAWVLLITCMWSRAINLIVCLDLTVAQFLRSLQEHIFSFGCPELILSDSGSSLVAGANVVSNMLNDPEVQNFLLEQGMRNPTFTQYSKGNPDIGGVVESCVKIAKRLLRGVTGSKKVLDIFDFQFLVKQTVCIANKRPIAYVESLRQPSTMEAPPAPITPEILLRGHDLVTLNVIPSQPTDVDPDWDPNCDRDAHIRGSFTALNKNRQQLVDIYQDEFLANLTRQATNTPGRYVSTKHEKLEVGDLVLLKQDHFKAVNFPMGIVKEVVINSIGEVTDAIILKGNKEKVKRHVHSLILLLKGSDKVASETEITDRVAQSVPKAVSKRVAAVKCRKMVSDLRNDGAI